MGQNASTPSPSPPPSDMPANHPITDSSTSPSACPVDHRSREAWIQAAQQHKSATDDVSSSASVRPRMTNSRLSAHRQVSTIPRAFPGATSPTPSDSAPAVATGTSSHGSSYSSPPAQPAQSTADPTSPSPNAQSSDPHTSPDGKWIYPSEEMFFAAMRRKSYDPNARDMSSIIPIHNAVNERTWSHILSWERPYATPSCPMGPQLVSFQGDSTRLTPRARWYGLLGYEKPFDRHDWVVERCGTRVEYVIDFYQGKQAGGESKRPLGPSFYLDVRPKLNSWEGLRMRMLKFSGMS